MHYFYEEKKTLVQAHETQSLSYGAHIHSHVEMVLLEKGRSDISVDFKKYTLTQGDVLLIFPHQVHQYHNEEGLFGFLLIFPMELASEFKRIFQRHLPVCPVLTGAGKDAEVAHLFRQAVWTALHHPPFEDTLLRGYLLATLSLLLPQIKLAGLPAAEPETIIRVLNYCQEHYTDDISLESVAKVVHLNKHYLSHLFHEKLHMGFRTYINMLRVSEACHLLKQDNHTITDIAYALGFNSTRSFNRVFLAHQGKTPHAYQNQA